MALLLMLEDNPADLRKAADIATRAGFTEFEATGYASEAQLYLENAMNGKVPLPNAIVVDLDLGIESGFELLRFWHRNLQLKSTPVIVWTGMGEHEQELCQLFHVYRVIPKDENPQVLMDTLASIARTDTDSTASLSD